MKYRPVSLLIFSIALVVGNDSFYESLQLEQVNNDQLYAFFNFTTTWKYSSEFLPQHYRLFPRAIGQLIVKYNIAELHFTMTQGLWRYEQWGYPYAPSPTGAQLWVWFHKNTKNIEQNWVGFTNALSGLFCASLNFMNKDVTATPEFSFLPSGLVQDGKVEKQFLKYAMLGRENLCTENLTPWMKLLPCGSMSGPASLLNPSRLQHSRFLAIGLHFKHDCHGSSFDCYEPFVQLQQHVSVVFDVRSARKVVKKFSLWSLFGQRMKAACPLATSSDVIIKTLPGLSLQNNLTKLGVSNDYYYLSLFDVKKNINLEFKWHSDILNSVTFFTGVIHHCYVTGTGLQGGLNCFINNHQRQNITVVFFQLVPWYLHLQLHTLRIQSEDNLLFHPTRISFTPASIRQTPHRLELVLNLPLLTSINLQVEFTRGFLTWTEHPPDANHGFYINPAIITARTTDLSLSPFYSDNVQRIYSETLIINVPVPDFSMPYNVICLVCTVVAISFGTFYNLTAKRMQLVSDTAPHSLVLLLQKLFALISRKKSIADTTS